LFEDFKEKIREQDQNSNGNKLDLSPEVLAKLKQEGIDPENCTLAAIPRSLRRGRQRFILDVRRGMGDNDNLWVNPQAPARNVSSVKARSTSAWARMD
jgi:hypothetical protein